MMYQVILFCGIVFILTYKQRFQKLVSKKPFTQRLEFVHITKTGGSSIEKTHNMVWGRCHYPFPSSSHCHTHTQPFWKLAKNKKANPIWHSPPHYLFPNPYRHVDTFTVVRNPYTRAISEYNCPWFGYKGENVSSPKTLNRWIQDTLRSIKPRNTFHLWPQYDYVYYKGERQITHILQYEHLIENFTALMQKYDLNVSIENVFVNRPRNHGFNISDLDHDSIQIINQHFRNDFEAFGYKKIPEKDNPNINRNEALDFIVIGVQKGGTSSMIAYLNQHPDVYIYPNEIHFFDKYYDKGIQWYEKHFESKKRIKGEKTPIYCYDKKSIDRIHSHYPNVKLIMLLREPIQRAYSQWNMCQARKTHPLKNVPFKKVIQNDLTKKDLVIRETDILQRGYYDDQIEYILSKFDRKNLYIGISEEIKANKNAEYAKIFNFLGVHLPDEFNTNVDRHIIKYRTPINDDMKQFLYKIYQPHVNRTYAMLGRKIDVWEEYYKS